MTKGRLASRQLLCLLCSQHLELKIKIGGTDCPGKGQTPAHIASKKAESFGMEMGVGGWWIPGRIPPGTLRLLHTPRTSGNFIDAIHTDISLPRRNYLLGCHYPKIDSFSIQKDRKSICPSS